MNWYVIHSEGFKLHVVSNEFVGELSKELVKRTGQPIDRLSADEILIDQPGMIRADRRYRDFVFDGLTLTIPSQDFEYYLGKFKNRMRERSFDDGSKYFKIKGWLACLVVSRKQLDEIISQMESIKDEVIKEGREDDIASFNMFFRGQLVEDVEDKELKRYVEWAKNLNLSK